MPMDKPTHLLDLPIEVLRSEEEINS
jgi:hypothetical protein